MFLWSEAPSPECNGVKKYAEISFSGNLKSLQKIDSATRLKYCWAVYLSLLLFPFYYNLFSPLSPTPIPLVKNSLKKVDSEILKRGHGDG